MAKSEINKMKVNTVFKFSWLILCFIFSCGMAQAQTTAFTYQGKLNDMSIAANGQYDLIFRLFDSAEGGGQIDGAAACNGVASGIPDAVCDDVSVTGGIFNVKLSFGEAAFISGEPRYLEIHVRPGASTDEYTRLSPRQEITSSPFSFKSLRAAAADSLSASCVLCVTDAKIQSIDGSKVTGSVANATTAVNVSGIVPIANGGTGSASKNFVDLTTNQTVAGNKTFSGALIGNGSGLTNVPGTFRWQIVSGNAQQAEPNNGYLTDNFEPVTITLPGAPNVGDTIRVTGLGAGGWRIAQNKGQKILGLDLDLNGIFWTPRETERRWAAIASSSDGTKLVTVADFDQIYTSTDSGATWTARESFRRWTSVASSADGNRLVAVGRNERIYVSINSGATWTARENGRFWTSVASSADGMKFIAATDGGQLYTSIDSGVNWTARETNRVWGSVASSSDGTKLVAAVFDGQIYTSTDSGATWTARETMRQWRSVASSADGTKLVAADFQGRIYTSSNSGVNWIPRAGDRSWFSVASSADGTKLIAAATNSKIYTSNDSGVSWTESEAFRNWQVVAASADGTKFFATGSFEKIYTSFLLPAETTTAGGAGYLVGGQFTSIELQYVGGGLFLPISRKGTIFGY